MLFNRVHFSSKSYNWDSPIKIFKELDKEFHFTLDPTNRPIAHLKGLADGLRMSYGTKQNPSIIYNNPPYHRGLPFAYVSKTIKEMRFGHVTLAVFLLPLRNSDYFKLLRKYNAEFRLCDKRLKFGDADNSSKRENNSAPFDSVVCVLVNPFETPLPKISL